MGDRCLACGGELTRTAHGVFDTRFGVDAAFDIGRCQSCGLEQTMPRPSGPELGQWYARYYNFGGEQGTAYTRLRQRIFESGIFRLWHQIDGDISFYFRPAPSAGRRLIDIGCNEGRGLSFYARQFATVEGLETNPVAAATARAKGFAVHECEVEEFQPAEKFDVAVLSNVLEHALDPAVMLRQIAAILKPGGEIWISCPNAKSWLRGIAGRAWINWHVPFHICHFDAETLQATLARAGLHQSAATQQTPALWVAQSLISAIFARQGVPTRQIRNPLLVLALMGLARGLAFPFLWAMNRAGRGDCLIAIARVPGSASAQPSQS